jgi:ribonucleoside-diphosphate reductase alpha chain
VEVPKEYQKYCSNYVLTPLAKSILEKKYFLKDSNGVVIENLPQMFYRVANNIAKADEHYGANVEETEELFFKSLISQELVPATPILMSAGNKLQFLFSDHALDVSDSIEAIFEMLKIAATIQQHGGGVGFNFSKIRPRFDEVSGMKNVAFGPLSVMNIFDTSFSAILQGGKRPGANMAILSVSHPDIFSFVQAKEEIGKLVNFNLSVAITDEFIEAVLEDKEFPLINPKNNEVVKKIKAKDLFDKISEMAWLTGEPGLVFIDEMNRKYPFNEKVSCISCCGQYELNSYEGVPYAHINLTKIIKKKENFKSNESEFELDLEKLKDVVTVGVHFLDNCIDMHKFPNEIMEKKSKDVRKIGLGVMGFADLLFMLKIEYGSDECIDLINEIMKVIKKESRKASKLLAFQRGTFPTYGKSLIDDPTRNSTITTIAPTGSTSIITGVSQSIEPVYALSYTLKTSSGEEMSLLNSEFKKTIDELKIADTQKIQLEFVDSVQGIDWLTEDFKRIFKTSHDVLPKDHLKVMATFQKYIDNSISKTINLPNFASIEDVKEILLSAHKLKCKGITVYRNGCREDQVLSNKRQTKLYAFGNEK